MYLASLTLKGFKSFADKTSIVFDPGLSVIVGPNGSGKSNISDAILWVLGEKSPKILRGQAMEDVIFAGSTKRSAVSMCEVCLVLNNDDHTLPIDFREVAITRRLYRSGENEYLINNSPARLRDIIDILHDSGLGKDTHSIISQGKLDAILASKPEDRRQLIEEAAGIAKHRRRKQLAEKKLEAMHVHLAMAKHTQREIARRLKPLERQLEQAQKSTELKQGLRKAQTMIATDDVRQLKQQYTTLEHSMKQADAQVELCAYREQEVQKSLHSYQVLLEQKGLFVGDLSEQRRRMHDCVGRLDSDMRLLEEKGKHMVERISEIRRSISALERSKAADTSEFHTLSADNAELAESLRVLKEQVQQHSSDFADVKKHHNELSSKIAALNAKQKATTQEYNSVYLKRAQAQEQIEQRDAQHELFSLRTHELEDELSQLTSRREVQARERNELASALDAQRATKDELTEQQTQVQQGVRELAQELQQAQQSLSDVRGKKQALESLMNHLACASEAQKFVRTSHDVSVASQVIDLFCVPAAYEYYVECVLRDVLSGFVVTNTLEELCAFVSSDEFARKQGAVCLVARDAILHEGAADSTDARSLPAETLTLHNVCAHSLYRAITPALPDDNADVAAADSSVADGLAYALLASWYSVDDVRALASFHRAYPTLNFVAPQGICLYADGRICAATSADDNHAFERKRMLASYTKELARLEDTCATLAHKHKTAQQHVDKLQEKRTALLATLSAQDARHTALTSEIAQINAGISRAQEQISVVTQKQHDADARFEQIVSNHKTYMQQEQELTAKLDTLSRELTSCLDERRELSSQQRHLDTRLSETKLSLARTQERYRHCTARAEQLSSQLATYDERISNLEKEAFVFDGMSKRVDPLYQCYQTLASAAAAWAEKLKSTATLAQADSDALKKTIQDAKDACEAARNQTLEAEQKQQELTIVKTKLDVQIEHAIERMCAYGYSLDDALSLEPLQDRAVLKRQIEHIEHELSELGPVNEAAQSEYDEIRTRYDSISAQVDDLETASASLKKITAAVERAMKKAFLASFAQINDNFSHIFSMLFIGGNGHLELTSPDNIDETGLEIIAQPQGKKVQKMSLLSGGEKSLCALALLFATYKARTVPFYVFDEIEAALDDINLSRLLGAIESLKASTQLIVISHQRRTMEQADVLYGISMHADGVSHVVSQRLEGAAQRP